MIEITHTDYEVFMRDTKDGTSSKQKIFHSQYRIREIVYYKLLERIVILYSYEYYIKDSQNVICIDTKGNLQWIVPPLVDPSVNREIMVRIGIHKKKYVYVTSFGGISRRIEVATGKVINQLFVK